MLRARIALGCIYFLYQRSIFTYCILESSRWSLHSCGGPRRGKGGEEARSPAWVFYLNTCLF